MDLDIDDILDAVSRPQHPDLTSPDFDTATTYAAHQQLTRLWTTERCTPDLQPYPTELMAYIMSRVQHQIAKIEDLTSSSYSSTSAETRPLPAPAPDPTSRQGREQQKEDHQPQNLNLTLSILQTDLSRTQFLIRSFLRQRLSKISSHAQFYLQRYQTSDTKVDLLSPSELNFLQSHQALLSGFYGASFLDAFPVALRRLDDSSGGVKMVEGPEGRVVVFVRCLAERWEGGSAEGVELRMKKGQVWVVRWEDCKKGVAEGVLEVL